MVVIMVLQILNREDMHVPLTILTVKKMLVDNQGELADWKNTTLTVQVWEYWHAIFQGTHTKHTGQYADIGSTMPETRLSLGSVLGIEGAMNKYLVQAGMKLWSIMDLEGYS